LPEGLVAVIGAGLGRPDGGLDPRLRLGADALVAQAAALVLTITLDLAPDVGHRSLSLAGREARLVGRSGRGYQQRGTVPGARAGTRPTGTFRPTVGGTREWNAVTRPRSFRQP